MDERIRFYKIVTWAVYEYLTCGRKVRTHQVIPICPNSDGMLSGNETSIESDDRIVGIVPAVDDYVVYGEDLNGEWIELGVHYGGTLAYNPNWSDELDLRIGKVKKE